MADPRGKTSIFAVILAALTLACVATAMAAVDVGYATAIYNNRDERDATIIFGRQFECTLKESSRLEAQDCAIEWCEEFCERSSHQNTCRCRIGRVADFVARGDVTKRDNSSTQRYDRKKRTRRGP